MVIRRISAAAWLLIALGAVFTIAGTQSAGAVGSPIGLGSAGSFAVLAGSTVTNTGESEISGDLGVSPGSAVTGFPPGIVTNGVIHAGSAVASQAQSDLTTAYNEAASRSTTATVTADLAGQTLLSGVYTGGALALNGTLTLDGENDPGAVFVFQASSTLITGPSSSINLINGADPCNVFWQVGSSATLGTGTDFVGTVMANVSITANTGATVDGRLLARTGAVTLDDNVINASNCGSSSGGTTTTTEADGGGDTTTTEGNAGGGDTTTTEGNAGGGDTTTTEGNAGGGDTTTTEGNAGGGDTTTTEGNAGGGDTTTTEGNAAVVVTRPRPRAMPVVVTRRPRRAMPVVVTRRRRRAMPVVVTRRPPRLRLVVVTRPRPRLRSALVRRHRRRLRLVVTRRRPPRPLLPVVVARPRPPLRRRCQSCRKRAASTSSPQGSVCCRSASACWCCSQPGAIPRQHTWAERRRSGSPDQRRPRSETTVIRPY
jgi:hypothetical protein